MKFDQYVKEKIQAIKSYFWSINYNISPKILDFYDFKIKFLSHSILLVIALEFVQVALDIRFSSIWRQASRKSACIASNLFLCRSQVCAPSVSKLCAWILSLNFYKNCGILWFVPSKMADVGNMVLDHGLYLDDTILEFDIFFFDFRVIWLGQSVSVKGR